MSDDISTGGEETEADATLAALRAFAALSDPVSPEAVAAARSALAWRTMDAELAELTADSVVEDDRSVLVRSVDVPTLLTFEAGALTVEVEVLVTGDSRRLLGQLVPPRPGAVDVDHRGGRLSVTADEMGRFSVDGVVAGPVSLRCRVGEAAAPRVVVTEWFLA